MVITYAELYSELSAADGSSEQILRDSTGKIFSEYLLSERSGELPADNSRIVSFDDNSRRVGIVNCICEGRYDSALFSLSVWLRDRISSGSEILTYDEAQFLAFLHIVLKNAADRESSDIDNIASADTINAYSDMNRKAGHKKMSFSRRTTRVLERMGISSYEEIDSLGKRGLCKMRGCGEKTLNEISGKMREMGYNW